MQSAGKGKRRECGYAFMHRSVQESGCVEGTVVRLRVELEKSQSEERRKKY